MIEPKYLEESMPHSPDAERAVCGAILLDEELLLQAERLLKPDDFYVRSLRMVYRTMFKVRDKGRPITPILIGEELRASREYEQVGGVAFITNLTYGLPHTTNIAHYASVIRDHAKARWLIKFADNISQVVRGGDKHPDEVAEWIMSEVGLSANKTRQILAPQFIEQMYDDQALRFQLFHKGISDAIPTGFPEIDEKLLGGGLLPSLMYVLAGRPSMGKTTLALDFCNNMADQGRRGLIVTRETPREMLLDRMVAAKSGVDRFKISAGMTRTTYEAAMETLTAMRLTPIAIDDSSTSIDEVDRWLAYFDSTGQRIEWIMLDYMQLCQGKGESRVQQVSSVSTGFKGLLVKYKIPGLAVSQLNRAPGDDEPELYHLRESGQIEQDADCVFFIHGDQTEEDLDFLQKELICKKQRDGPHFRRPLDMNSRLVTFRRPDMLGLAVSDGGAIQRRKIGTDEEELAKEKTRQQTNGKKKRAGKDEIPFNF